MDVWVLHAVRTSARQTDALSHGRRLAKLRHVMWRALNQWAGRILVRGVIIVIMQFSCILDGPSIVVFNIHFNYNVGYSTSLCFILNCDFYDSVENLSNNKATIPAKSRWFNLPTVFRITVNIERGRANVLNVNGNGKCTGNCCIRKGWPKHFGRDCLSEFLNFFEIFEHAKNASKREWMSKQSEFLFLKVITLWG